MPSEPVLSLRTVPRRLLVHTAFLLAAVAVVPGAPAAARPALEIHTNVGGAITADTTWTAADSPYVTTDDLQVAAGAHLTIEPGVTLRLGPRHRVDVEGRLTAEGTADAPIRWEAATDGEAWEALRIAGQGELRHVELHGGGARRAAMLELASSDVRVRQSTVIDSAGAGIDIAEGASPTLVDNLLRRASVSNANPPAALRVLGGGSPVIEGNRFETNPLYAMSIHPNAQPTLLANRFLGNGFDGALVRGNVTGHGVLPAIGGRDHAYYVRGTQLIVEPGASLTWGPGSTVRMGAGSSVWVDGSLRLLGQPGREVLFTADTNTGLPGQWREVRFRRGSLGYAPSTGEGSLIRHAVFELGGADVDGPLVLETDVHVAHTIVRSSANRGVTVSGEDVRPLLLDVRVGGSNDPDTGDGLLSRRGAAPTVRFSVFHGNHHGVRVERDATADLSGHNRFQDNIGFAVRNEDPESCVEAGNASWGAPSGPRDASGRADGCGLDTWDGDGQVVSDGVRYLPFEGQLQRPTWTSPRCGAVDNPQPAVAGFAPPGSTVVLYVDGQEAGRTTAGPSEGGPWGPFTWRPEAPLPEGSHVLHARAVDGASASAPSDPLGVVIDPNQLLTPDGITLRQTLDGTTYVQPYASESGCTVLGDGTWQARFHPGAPLTLELPVACSTGVSEVGVRYNGQPVPTTAAGDDRYRATFDMGEGGTLEADVRCGQQHQRTVLGTVNVALDGFVYDRERGFAARIEGATVTLFVFDPALDNYKIWDGAAYYGQQNPQITPFAGWYAFYPPPGDYRIVVDAQGYERYVGPPLKIDVEPVLVNAPLRSSARIFLPIGHRP